MPALMPAERVAEAALDLSVARSGRLRGNGDTPRLDASTGIRAGHRREAGVFAVLSVFVGILLGKKYPST